MIALSNQVSALDELKLLAATQRKSVLIEGPSGSGKTFLAKEYARLLDVDDVIVVEPTVNAIRGAIDTATNLGNPILIVIENIDEGVRSASNTILKSLEEPAANIYIVITCVNILNVLDTIISRSVLVSVGNPTYSDLETFCTSINADQYGVLKQYNSDILKTLNSYADVLTVLNMSFDELQYYSELRTLSWKDSVSNIVWKLTHYKDNTNTPVQLVIRYILVHTQDAHMRRNCIHTLKDLQSARIASSAAITRFVFEGKYGE